MTARTSPRSSGSTRIVEDAVAPDLALRLERVEIVDHDHGQPGIDLIETDR